MNSFLFLMGLVALPWAHTTPIVAVLALPNDETHIVEAFPWANWFFPASYVKWLEMAALRVVYIVPSMSNEDIKKIFDASDGIFFTGGMADIVTGRYADVQKMLLEMVIEANTARPGSRALWGTCLGFEAILWRLSAMGPDLVKSVPGTSAITLPLTVSPDCLDPKGGCDLIGHNTPREVTAAFTRKNSPVLYHHHYYGVYADEFLQDANLTKHMRLVASSVVSTEDGGNGRPFVSVAESVRPAEMPIYVVQFHPEKASFETAGQTGNKVINHAPDSIHANNYLVTRFVKSVRTAAQLRVARRGMVYMSLPNDILNQAPFYTANVTNFAQMYFFV